MKKILLNLSLILISLLSVVGLSACCEPADLKIDVIFDNVDPNMGVETYVQNVDYGEDLSVEFVIPEGYEHHSMTAMLKSQVEKQLEFEVELEDEEVEYDYEYSTSKTIRLSIQKVTLDFDIVFDMSQVRLKEFDITFDDQLIKTAETQDKGGSNYSTNIKLLKINPEYINRLVSLDSTTVLGEVVVGRNSAKVNYGEYIAICYTKSSDKLEIPTMYADIGHFTDVNKISTTSGLRYVQYNVATRGNTYYNLIENNSTNTFTRVYYIGKIQEDVNLYKAIPNLEVAKGYNVSHKNQFTLLTNLSDYASESLTINFFAPTEKSYNASDEGIDQISGVNVEKIKKYSEGGELNNPEVLYEYIKRYDAYNMYVGDNKAQDSLLTTKEKQTLPEELYFSIKTTDALRDGLDVKLLVYEKQRDNDHYTYQLTLTETATSLKGEKFYKLDTDVVSEFLLDRAEGVGQDLIPYKTGNAILNVRIAETVKYSSSFPYSSFTYPISFGSQQGSSLDYQVEFYVLNEDGSKDYGFVDMHNGIFGDYVFFETDKLWKKENDGSWTCLDNLYVNIRGLDYNDYYSPVIERIYIKYFDVNIETHGIPVTNPRTLNGIEGYRVDYSGQTNQPYYSDQYKIAISLIITNLNTDVVKVNFNNMDFSENSNSDAVYVTNTFRFNSLSDFIRVDNLSCTGNIDLAFGTTTDIYYFALSDAPLDFDVYVGHVEEGTNKYVGIKDENRKISSSKKLYDIAGNEIIFYLNGRPFNIYVKYQDCEVYNLQGSQHFAYK